MSSTYNTHTYQDKDQPSATDLEGIVTFPVWRDTSGKDVESLFRKPDWIKDSRTPEEIGQSWCDAMITKNPPIYFWDMPDHPNNVYDLGSAIYGRITTDRNGDNSWQKNATG